MKKIKPDFVIIAAAKVGGIKIYYGGKTGRGKRIDMEMESPYYIFTITATTLDDEPVFRDGTFILLK